MRLYTSIFLILLTFLASGCGGDEGFVPAGPENNGFDGVGGGEWSAVAPISVGGRQEVSVLALGEEMFVLGGFEPSLSIVPTVEVYSPQTDTWRSVAPMPARAHHINAAVVDGKIVVAGFLTERSFLADGRTFIYDPGTDTWEEKAPMPEGTARGASAAASVDGKIYVMGGFRGAAVSISSVYDPQTDAWASIAPMPIVSDHATAQAIDGKVYVFGGRNTSISAHTARVFAYDPALDVWAEKAPMPTSRAGLASAMVDGKVYVMGGEGNPNHVSGVFSDNEAYDPETDTWEVVRPMLTRRHGTGAAAIGGFIYVPGGAAVERFSAIAVNERYKP